MFHKVPLFILSFFLMFSFSGYSLGHFEHYGNLILQGQIFHIKEIIVANEGYLPSESYENLLYHIHIAEETLNQVYPAFCPKIQAFRPGDCH